LTAEGRRIGTVIGRDAQNLRRVRGKEQRALKNAPLDPMTGQMTQPIQAAAAVTPAATTGGTAPAATTSAAKRAKSFAGELASATKPVARPDGEQTKKIAGHPYAQIENGDDKGKYVNQMAGNPRQGSVFRLVERGDHVFHVYGTGADKVIVGLKAPGTANSA
jgi:hypothetical protein